MVTLREIFDPVVPLMESNLLDFTPRSPQPEEVIHWRNLVFNRQTTQSGNSEGKIVDTPFYYVDLETGEEIGGFVIEPSSGNTMSIHTEIHPQYQRKGYGTIIYDFAEHLAKQAGKRLVSSERLTTAAKNFWKKRDAKKAKLDEGIRPKYLYHGTLVKNLPMILATGLEPRAGANTKAFHRSPDPLVLASDIHHLLPVVNAITFHMNQTLKHPSKGWKGWTIDDLETYGAVIVVDASNFDHRPLWKQPPPEGSLYGGIRTSDDDYPLGTEENDYYATGPVKVVKVLQGKPMIDWLRRHFFDNTLPYRVADFDFSSLKRREAINEILKETPSQEPTVLYSAISKSKLSLILETGIQPPPSYWTPHQELVDYYAETILDEDEEPVILRVPMHQFDPIGFAPDMPSIAEPINTFVRRLHGFQRYFDVEEWVWESWQRSSRDYKASLNLVGSCVYTKPLQIGPDTRVLWLQL